MKKELTLEDINSINHQQLVKMLYSLIATDDTLYKKIEKLFLAIDGKELYKSITKDINSIKRGRKFIHYGESFDFSRKIALIVEDIENLVKDDKSAVKLLKELILTDSKVYLRSDDSAGAIQNSYALARNSWKEKVVTFLDDKTLLKDLEDMLICDGFGARDIFSSEFPDVVLRELYDRVRSRFSLEKESSLHHALLEIAHSLKLPELYVETKKLENHELKEYDFLDIAQEYKEVGDAKNTLVWLKKIDKDFYRKDILFQMFIWAYETLEDKLNVILSYREWYERTKTPEIFKQYLSKLEGEAKEQAKFDVLKDIEKLTFSHAVHFYHEIGEKELCASYILKHQDEIETSYMGQKSLKSFLSWLSDEYPQEAILIYRDICDANLETSQSKYYRGSIWALKEMIKLEKIHQPLAWKVETNDNYIANLLEKHKQKRKFLELYHEAL